jgi:hypothetical protein
LDAHLNEIGDDEKGGVVATSLANLRVPFLSALARQRFAKYGFSSMDHEAKMAEAGKPESERTKYLNSLCKQHEAADAFSSMDHEAKMAEAGKAESERTKYLNSLCLDYKSKCEIRALSGVDFATLIMYGKVSIVPVDVDDEEEVDKTPVLFVFEKRHKQAARQRVAFDADKGELLTNAAAAKARHQASELS